MDDAHVWPVRGGGVHDAVHVYHFLSRRIRFLSCTSFDELSLGAIMVMLCLLQGRFIRLHSTIGKENDI